MSERTLLNIVGKAGVGKSTGVEYVVANFDAAPFSPSSVLRSYAQAHGIPLRSRSDYVICNRILNERNRYALIDPILASDKDMCIDGLRAPGLARFLIRTLGMRTLALVCDDEVRTGRIPQRPARDGSSIITPEAILSDEKADVSTDPFLPNTELVIAMHDLSGEPLNTNRPKVEWFSDVDALVAPFFHRR